jgi:hypothetical protein
VEGASVLVVVGATEVVVVSNVVVVVGATEVDVVSNVVVVPVEEEMLKTTKGKIG